MEIDKVPNAQENSPISFLIEPSSGVPTYLQIVQQVENALRVGLLKVGDRLPRVKDVVEASAINPNTVLKAYKDLEQKGLAEGKQGIGTFIVASPHAADLKDFIQLKKSFSQGWLKQARNQGLDNDSILAIIQLALTENSEQSDKSASKGRARA